MLATRDTISVTNMLHFSRLQQYEWQRQLKLYQERTFPPKTKELQCLICFQKVERADYRRKLFTSKGKTNACHDLELILGEELLNDDQQPSTKTVCRNCATKNSNYVKQFYLSVRQKYKALSIRIRWKF